jgi:hypothetical protein
MVTGRAHDSLLLRLDRRSVGEALEGADALSLSANAELLGEPMPAWIKNIPDLALYPVGWYLDATEWIENNPQKTFWLGLAAVVGALVI